jgi:hypothetical protein
MKVKFTLKEFSALDTYKKAVLIFHDGSFLMDYSDKYVITQLYALRNFYVEIVIAIPAMNVVDIKAFSRGKRLDKYLENIKLPRIVK